MEQATPPPTLAQRRRLARRPWTRWTAGLLGGVCALGAATGSARAATFTVINNANAGIGSFRQAIIDANTTAGVDTIEFKIPGAGVHTIAPTAALPDVTQAVTIDGTSQPGFAGSPLIELSGISAPGGANGLTLKSSNIVVNSLVINSFFLGNGVEITGASASNNQVVGCRIGTNAAGTGAAGNFSGVTLFIGAKNNVIGGPGAARNIISGNKGSGIEIKNEGTNGNVVQGNYIGTSVTGASALSNGNNGIIINQATNNLVGGTGQGEGNVISANDGPGVFINDPDTTGNKVQGNKIGTNVSGNAALGNGGPGVKIEASAQNNTVGGDDATDGSTDGNVAARNIISANGEQGVFLNGSGTNLNLVQGNYIGVGADGVLNLGNTLGGVEITSGAQNNKVGGTTAGSGNVISGNTGDGVLLSGDGTSANKVLSNKIGTNAAGTAGVINLGNGVAIADGAINNSIGSPNAGNLLSGNQGNGVDISDATTTGNRVQSNKIGTNLSGLGAIQNNSNGIEIQTGAGGNTIGGNTAALRNIISGNNGSGVILFGAGSANVISGNYLGVNAAGTGALPNSQGVYMTGSTTATLVGGATAGERNVISGNVSSGVRIEASKNFVRGNYIGVNVTGAVALGNGADGVEMGPGASSNTIGGTAAGVRNIISANGIDGVSIQYDGASSNLVQSNFIGLNAGGSAALPNARHGVFISNGATTNLIGGTAVLARNVIAGNGVNGINISGVGTTGNKVQGNYIGTKSAGSVALPNAKNGISITIAAAGNFIGGATATPGTAAGNVISGNALNGISILDAGTNSTSVLGNLIGTKAGGLSGLPNGANGVLIANGAQKTQVGAGSAASRNVISGNTGDGVRIANSGANSNFVQGNYIGLRADGTAALSNLGNGVQILNGAASNSVGGAGTGLGNVISGNKNAGILITDVGTTGNKAQRNLIGTKPDGSTALPNLEGVHIAAGASNNFIGGSAAVNGNVIASNTRDGVVVTENASLHNSIRANSIVSNGGLGINLRPVGEGVSIVTPNDANDPDAGPNTLQNFPVLTGATVAGGNTTITGTLNSTPSTTFTVNFYASLSADPSGFGEGKSYLGNKAVTTNAAGNVSFSFTATGDFTGQAITATATQGAGDTSEFSGAKTATVISAASE